MALLDPNQVNQLPESECRAEVLQVLEEQRKPT